MSARSEATLHAGFAEVDITPGAAMPLAGIGGNRQGLGVLDPLWAKALVFGKGDRRAALVALDLLWVTREFCDRLRERAARELGMAGPELMVTATHTHSGPLTSRSGGEHLPDPAYLDRLEDAIVQALGQAAASAGPCAVAAGQGATDVAINRRRKVLDPRALKRLRLACTIANRPNPGGPVDRTLSVLRLQPEDGGREVLVVNAACHPAVWRGEAYSADFPGRMAQALAPEGPRPAVLFLQGYSGDLRERRVVRAPLRFFPPDALYACLFDRVRFAKESTAEDLDNLAARLARDVRATELRPLAVAGLRTAMLEARLPLAGRQDGLPVRLHALALHPGVCLVGVEGEVFCSYATWLRRAAASCGLVLPVGLCGGAAGYIPDDAALAQGGYEVERSLDLFGVPAPVAVGAEAVLKQAMGELVAQCLAESR